MRYLFSLFLVLPFSVSISDAAADTPFVNSIPLDVAEALFDFGIDNNFAVYSDIMDDFPEFEMPSDFEVVGSVLQNRQMRVVLTTQLNEADAIEAIASSYLDDGWINMPQFNPRPEETGFVSAENSNIRPRYQMICHDDHGQMNMSYRQRSSENYLVMGLGIGFGFNRNWQSCQEMISQQEMSLARMSGRNMGIQQYMPRLELPDGTTQGGYQPLMIGGGGGGNNSYETDATVEIEMDLEDVFQHFADQIVEQGWSSDSESVGTATATGTWTKTVENDTNIVGRLNIVRSDDSVYDLSMQVEVPGGSRLGTLIFSN